MAVEKASRSVPPADTFSGMDSSRVEPSGPRETETLEDDRANGAAAPDAGVASDRCAAADSFHDAGRLCSCGCGDRSRSVSGIRSEHSERSSEL